MLIELSIHKICVITIFQHQTHNRTQAVTKMFFVLGITWIAEVVLFLLNYMFAYDKGGGDCPSIPTNAAIIKASFLFDCINAFQGIIMFCVLVFDASMIRKLRKYFCKNTKKSAKIRTGASLDPKMENIAKLNIDGEVQFDHHEQQLTIRTNRTWRTPSPQPTSGMQPVSTQVEVTEEFCSRVNNAIEHNDDVSRGLEITRFELTRHSGNCNECCQTDIGKQDGHLEQDKKVDRADFSMQFP